MLVPVRPDLSLNVVDRGGGSPVVLVHGWSLSHEAWGETISFLEAAGHRVVALDLRGHGASKEPADGAYAISDLAADVAAVLEVLDLRHATVVGWSLGGMVGLRVAADHPERVGRLVLVASNGVAHARRPRFEFGSAPEKIVAQLEAGEVEAREVTRRSVLAAGFASAPEPAVLEDLLRISLQTGTPAALAALRTLMLTDQVDLLARVSQPVVQILGADDPSVSRQGGDWLVEELVDATQVVLPSGHYPMHEAPDAFREALLAAVGGLPVGDAAETVA